MTPLPALLALLGAAAVLTGTALADAPAPSRTGWPGGPGGVTGAVVPRTDPRPSVAASAVGSPARLPVGPLGAGAGSTARGGPDAGGAGPSGADGGGDRPVTGGDADHPVTGGFGLPVLADARVLRRFAPGPYPWSPGHRGVDLAGSGPQVLAAGAGVVGFAGVIAGRGVLVVRHGGGLRTTYEPVAALVPVGRAVSRGEPIGTLAPAAAHCPGTPCLHWGALVGDRYLDPLTLLTGPRRRPVLLPLGDGR